MIDQPKNPFTNCYADGIIVKSDYWHVHAKTDEDAQMFAELIQAAYRAGKKSKVAEIRNALDIATSPAPWD